MLLRDLYNGDKKGLDNKCGRCLKKYWMLVNQLIILIQVPELEKLKNNFGVLVNKLLTILQKETNNSLDTRIGAVVNNLVTNNSLDKIKLRRIKKQAFDLSYFFCK